MDEPAADLVARVRAQVAAARARIGASFQRLWLEPHAPADQDEPPEEPVTSLPSSPS